MGYVPINHFIERHGRQTRRQTGKRVKREREIE
jgi:hypothetical protein